MRVTIEQVKDLHPAEIGILVAESRIECFEFIVRLQVEWESGANRFDGPGEALFAAHSDGEIAGICGLNFDPYARCPRVGRLRRLYVRPAFRRNGIGRLLVQRVLEEATISFHVVRLRTGTRAAARFYEKIGFVPANGEETFTHALGCGAAT